MRALVTGAAGFVGGHLLRELRARGHQSHAMALPGETLAADLAEVPVHPCDITDAAGLAKVMGEVAPEWIFHLAALSHPGTCRQNPLLAWEVNFVGTHNVFRAAADAAGDARVLFVGSAAEYGRPSADDLPITEDSPLDPRDVYAATKLAGDLLGAQFALSGRLAVLRVRPFNHIGPGQGPGFVATDFARQLARIEKGLQEPRVEVGNLSSSRDFTDVRDVVRAYVLVLEKGQPGAVYNVCSETGRRIRELLDELIALTKTPVEVTGAPGRIRRDDADVIVGCAEALRTATGWTPEIPWELTLADILDDWRRRIATEDPA